MRYSIQFLGINVSLYPIFKRMMASAEYCAPVLFLSFRLCFFVLTLVRGREECVGVVLMCACVRRCCANVRVCVCVCVSVVLVCVCVCVCVGVVLMCLCVCVACAQL